VSGRKVLTDLDYLDTRSTERNAQSITSFDSAYEACAGAHAIAVLTEWDEFVDFDWQKIYDSMQKPAFVFDGRNLLNGAELKGIGFVYQAIGS
jgi:UDPglucose 6-dehydrogenase